MEMSKIGVMEVWESEDKKKYILVIKDPSDGNTAKFSTLTLEEMDGIAKTIAEHIG